MSWCPSLWQCPSITASTNKYSVIKLLVFNVTGPGRGERVSMRMKVKDGEGWDRGWSKKEGLREDKMMKEGRERVEKGKDHRTAGSNQQWRKRVQTLELKVAFAVFDESIPPRNPARIRHRKGCAKHDGYTFSQDREMNLGTGNW